MCFRPVLLTLLKTSPHGIPSVAFCLLSHSFEGLFVHSFVSVSVDWICIVCVHACAFGRGAIEWPRPRGSLHSFHYNPADLLCQPLPFTVPLTCPLPHMSLQHIENLTKKNPPWMQKPPHAESQINRCCVHLVRIKEMRKREQGCQWRQSGELYLVKFNESLLRNSCLDTTKCWGGALIQKMLTILLISFEKPQNKTNHH